MVDPIFSTPGMEYDWAHLYARQQVPFMPGMLETTRFRTAIADNFFQDALNCSTERDAFELDRRYRQFSPPPFCSSGDPDTIDTGVAYGLGYGTFSGKAEIAMVYKRPASATPNDTVGFYVTPDAQMAQANGATNALTNVYNKNRAIEAMTQQDWIIWQHSKYMFMTNELSGGKVYYWAIRSDKTEKLYKLYGVINSTIVDNSVPPYNSFTFGAPDLVEAGVLDAGGAATEGVWTFSEGGLKCVIDSDPTGWHDTYHVGRVELDAVQDLSRVDYLAYIVRLETPDCSFSVNDINHQLWINDSTATTEAQADATRKRITAKKITFLSGSLYMIWFDLTGFTRAYRSTISWLHFVFVVTRRGPVTVSISPLVEGGIFLNSTPGVTMIDQAPGRDLDIEYATSFYDSTTLVESNATKYTFSGENALGSRPNVNLPYLGAKVRLRVPGFFTPAADKKIRVYRRLEATQDWYRIEHIAGVDQVLDPGTGATVDVIDDLTEDEVESSGILSDPSFDAFDASGSGEVTKITCGCSWKGCNVYFDTRGFAYFSKFGDFKTVLWQGLTFYDPAVGELAQPRTVQVSFLTGQPVIAAVPAEALYMATRREVYAMVGRTAAVAQEPKQLPNAKGCISKRGMVKYGAGALMASDDGLYYLEVPYHFQGTGRDDKSVEITKHNRPKWKKLIWNSETTRDDAMSAKTVVVAHDGWIWCFCENRYLRMSAAGKWMYGEFQVADQVKAAFADTKTGIVLLFGTGRLCTIGEYLTDRGTNAAGDNGTAPTWFAKSKRVQKDITLQEIRAQLSVRVAGTPSLQVDVWSELRPSVGDEDSVTITQADVIKTLKRNPRSGGRWFEVKITGNNQTICSECLLGIVPGSELRSK